MVKQENQVDFQAHMDDSDPDQPANAHADLGPSYCIRQVRYIRVL